MAGNNGYLGYNTYIQGTTKSVSDCLGIVVYSKASIQGKMSLYNMNSVFRKVIESGDYLRITRPTKNDRFKYISDLRPSGFDVIVYLSNTDNTPIGYTEFLSVQGRNRNIDISLRFETTYGGESALILANSLSNLDISGKVFIGKEPWEYTSLSDIDSDIRTQDWGEGWTKSIAGLRSGKSIYLGNRAIDKYFNSTSLKYLDYINGFDLLNVGFDRFQFGILGEDDIVIYAWKDLKYYIQSISKLNHFQVPIVHTPSNLGYFEVPRLDSEQRILGFTGRYIEVSVSSERRFYDALLKDWIDLDSSDLFSDTHDPANSILVYPRLTSLESKSDYVPEIQGLWLSPDLKKSGGLELLRRHYGWFVFRQRIGGSDNLLYWVNQSKCVVTSELKDNVMPVNNQILAIKHDTGTWQIYREALGTYWTEQAMGIKTGSTMKDDEDLGIKVCTDSDLNTRKTEWYQSGKVVIEKTTNKSLVDFTRSWFWRIKKHSLDIELKTWPDILGFFRGTGFYRIGNRIIPL